MISIDITKRLRGSSGPFDAHFVLEIHTGEFITLFGPSGAGKTTLLRCLAGLETPLSGTIEVDGEVWFDSDKKINLPPQKRRVGFVFQDYALFPTMSVKENLLYAAQNNEQRRYVDSMLEMIDLTSLASHRPATLSGGQKQRVALARALIQHPKILLLDEPLSALDPAMRGKLQRELTSIHHELGISTLLVSHDMGEAIRLSTRIASIHSGKIDRITPALEFFTPPSETPYAHLDGEIIDIEQRTDEIILTLLIGHSLVKKTIPYPDARAYSVGEMVKISISELLIS